MFMVMMMSNSSSIAATKSMTVRLSHSRSSANVVASVRAMSFLLNGSICAATLSKMSCRLSMLQIPYVLARRSEEHTSELQSLMRISYAVFCLKKTTHIWFDTITNVFYKD